MGGVKSSEDVSTYDFVKKANRHLYGEAQQCKKNSTKVQVVIKERFCENKEIKDNFAKYIGSKVWKSNHFTTVSAKIVGSEGQYCGTCASNHKLIVVMQHLQRDLAGEIKRRNTKIVSDRVSKCQILVSYFCRITTQSQKYGTLQRAYWRLKI